MTGDKPGLPDIKRDVPTAIHVQISEHIRLRIASGTWPAHYRLKSEPELAQEYGVSRGTLRRALTTLIEEGLLRQVRGRGTFVTSTTIEPAIAQKLSTLSEDFASQGVVTTTTVGECTLIAHPPRRRPARRHTRHPRPAPDPRPQNRPRPRRPPLQLRPHRPRPRHREDRLHHSQPLRRPGRHLRTQDRHRPRTFSAEAATTDVATELDLGQGDPVQYLQQVTYLDDGRPVEYSDVWIHSGRLRVTSLLLRR
ncbi:UTRA domain-containing protein OS=Streptomyces rutgersensis OX=53451 GN=F0345_28595 PE=4 SV=1 [Streptomyces diastaticus subsp. diastaticus]